ncbi:RagB/SusD family nutrient uptake outer membrane protein [Gelidibacter salicanalis]|uniref:RagB/SusD family nutrient uptake outer membrane protein n=1 Tax=Gelidibacter salicanalis TaxID=291193 RepID=A0A934KUU8_9FLAO|nr:RagB/SusD family nutrient uptake outer membrane protein [Gelidibacter salicanalis]MBJ7879820.1 RagB/SusD family nutrient uptake outer membrane protein [Gelidibacter salicanalis]
MKNINFIALIFIMLFSLGCSDDLLDKLPEDQIAPESYWKTSNDLKLYLNQFYTSFPVHSGYNGGIFEFDNNSDNLADIFVNDRFVGNTSNVPSTDGSWNYRSIRSVNFYLENSGTAQGDEGSLNHYNGEAYFFRAMFYYNLLRRYGGVPYINKVLNTDSPELYSARMARNELATKIVEDLDRAIANLKPRSSAEAFRVHQGMALSLKSTVCLYEGTWEKYHNDDVFAAPTNESAKFLQWAVDASSTLIEQGEYTLYNNGTATSYYNLFNQVDYSGISEVMFWKKYNVADGVSHYVGHYLPHTGSGTGLTKSLVDSYLSIDGNPIAVSPLYSTSQELSLTTIAKDRDPRLAQTIDIPGDLLTENTGVPNEIFEFPTFRGNNEITNTTGYQIYKGGPTDNVQRYDSFTGAIIYRYAEVLLNFAEAKAELGNLTQDDLDASINLLRARVGMPAMSISPVSDPNKDFPGLSDLINEVRRERRVEMALEGKRFDDLMRWAAADELIVGKRWLGFKIIGSDLEDEFSDLIGSSILVNSDGYIDPYMNTIPEGFGFKLGRDYLSPIPTEQIILSQGNLTQNPGWE